MARPGGNPDLYKSGFTKDRQPAKNGRKKSQLNVIEQTLNIDLALNISKENYYDILRKIATATEEEMIAMANNKKLPVTLRIYIKALNNAIKIGDIKTVNELLDRVFGRPTQSINVKNEITMTEAEVDAEIERLNKILSEKE